MVEEWIVILNEYLGDFRYRVKDISSVLVVPVSGDFYGEYTFGGVNKTCCDHTGQTYP